MANQRLYRLAGSTVVEPLVDRWYAWSFLISPVTASLHLLNYQVKTMQSYLANPDIHVKACRDPRLIGGPFMDIAVERAGEVRLALQETLEKRAGELELARTIIEYQNFLVQEAKGQSFEPYYDLIPDPLRGYVELVYDYFNRPSVRFIEGLLYESGHYDRSLQSLRIAELKRDGSRPFFISTPRLGEPSDINWPVSFDDARVDELFKLDRRPQALGQIRELLDLRGEDDQKLLSLVTEEPAPFPERWKEKEVRIRYIGHACVLLEWNGVSILTDPYIGVRPTTGGMARFSYDDLPEKIDYALVTHNHQDHCSIETLIRLRGRIECLVFPKPFRLLYGDVSLKMMANRLGFRNVVELDALESIPIPGGEIIAIPFMGEHGDLAHSKTAYVVRAGTEQMLFAADSDCLDRRVYENVRKAIGPVETLFLGTESVGAPLSWICGPLFPKRIEHNLEQTRRYHGANARTALEMVEAIGAKRIYNYAMGMEPWLDHLLGLCLTEDSPQIEESNLLIRKARGRGLLVAERLFGGRDFGLPPENQAYWEHLAEGAPRLGLPRDCPPDASWRRETEQLSFQLDEELCAALDHFARREGCPLAVVLLSAFQVLLYRITGVEDILIQTGINDPAASGAETRRHEATTLPARIDVSEDPPFKQLVLRTRESLSMSFRHMKSSPAAAAETAPASVAAFFFDGRDERQRRAPEPGDGTELALSITGDERSLTGTFAYVSGLFVADTIEAMIESYQALIEGILNRPTDRLLDLPLYREGRSRSANAGSRQLLSNDAEDKFFF
jgi:L-ascorbate metabolism protein UlaG (beta-lactamase superfamily)